MTTTTRTDWDTADRPGVALIAEAGASGGIARAMAGTGSLRVAKYAGRRTVVVRLGVALVAVCSSVASTTITRASSGIACSLT